MKTFLLNILIVLATSVSLAQPLCDFQGKDSLFVHVVGDTVNIWDLAACGDCASRFAVTVTLSSDTLYIMQEDTSSLKALCDCLFNLSASFVGPPSGTTTAVIYRDWHKKFPGLSQPLFIGSIQFQYNPPGGPGFSF